MGNHEIYIFSELYGSKLIPAEIIIWKLYIAVYMISYIWFCMAQHSNIRPCSRYDSSHHDYTYHTLYFSDYCQFNLSLSVGTQRYTGRYTIIRLSYCRWDEGNEQAWSLSVNMVFIRFECFFLISQPYILEICKIMMLISKLWFYIL